MVVTSRSHRLLGTQAPTTAPPSCREATALPLLCPGLTGPPGLEASPSPTSPFLPLRGARLNCWPVGVSAPGPEKVLLWQEVLPGIPWCSSQDWGRGARQGTTGPAGLLSGCRPPRCPCPTPWTPAWGGGAAPSVSAERCAGLGSRAPGQPGTGSCGAWCPWRPPPGRPRKARVGPWFRLLWVPRLVGVGPRGRPLRPVHQHLPRDLERGLAPRGGPVRTRAGAALGLPGPWNRDASALRQPRGVWWRGDHLHGCGLVGPRARGRWCVPPEDPPPRSWPVSHTHEMLGTLPEGNSGGSSLGERVLTGREDSRLAPRPWWEAQGGPGPRGPQRLGWTHALRPWTGLVPTPLTSGTQQGRSHHPCPIFWPRPHPGRVRHSPPTSTWSPFGCLPRPRGASPIGAVLWVTMGSEHRAAQLSVRRTRHGPDQLGLPAPRTGRRDTETGRDREIRTERERHRGTRALLPAEYGSCFSGWVNSSRSYLARIHCSRRSLGREGRVSPGPSGPTGRGGSWHPTDTRPLRARVSTACRRQGRRAARFDF